MPLNASIRNAAIVGFNMEVNWNRDMRLVGHYWTQLPVPSLSYRLWRSAHMAQMAARENLALAIAPWLDPLTLP